jgi:hypothetical protein
MYPTFSRRSQRPKTHVTKPFRRASSHRSRPALLKRFGITGARWSLAGAQAMLWMRAIAASSDLPAYWNWHIAREHHRNHLSKLHNPPTPHHALALAA